MKKKLIGRLVITCLAFSLILTNSLIMPTHAETNTNESYNLSEIETIAKNAPQFILVNDKKEWSDVDVINYKPLYDFNDKLIAYSLDLKSKINNKDAFAIISTNEEDGPILEFGVDLKSPYDKITDDSQTYIYDGIEGYYSHGKSNDKYHDLVTNKDLNNTSIEALIDNSKNKEYISREPSIAKQNRLNLEQGIGKNSKIESTTSSEVTLESSSLNAHILTNVPDYQWYLGCAPTSSAMVLKCLYSSQLSSASSNTLISKLATAMGTNSSGSTTVSKIPTGIKSVMSSYGVSVSATNYSGSSATFSRAVSQIDLNRPFVLSLIGSKETAPSYPNGFGDHSMACIGYYTDSTSSYLVVHDTGCDGSVYCDFNSSALGTPYYTFVN